MRLGISQEQLTTRLKNILDEYPVGAGPFKEFLQNADDAKVRRRCFCERTALEQYSYS